MCDVWVGCNGDVMCIVDCVCYVCGVHDVHGVLGVRCVCGMCVICVVHCMCMAGGWGGIYVRHVICMVCALRMCCGDMRVVCRVRVGCEVVVV